MAAGRIFGVATTLGILAAGVWISLHGRGTVPSDAQVARVPAVDTASALPSLPEAGRIAAATNPFAARSEQASASVPAVVGVAGRSATADAERAGDDAHDDAGAAPAEDAAAGPGLVMTSVAPATEMVDLVLAFERGTDLALVRQEVESLGGEILREYEHLPMRAVRVPADAVATLTQRGDLVAGVRDEPVEFMALSAGQQTAKLPAPGTTGYVGVSSSVGVAVLDSGVAEQGDINVVEHVHIATPATWYAASTARADAGLAALYIFDERNGDKVYDRIQDHASGPPMHLGIEDPVKVAWSTDKLTAWTGARLSNSFNANKIYNACKASNALTVEAWVTPASAAQAGWGRIVTMSADGNSRNFTLVQNNMGQFELRVRTSTNGLDGSTVLLTTAKNKATTALQHIVATRAASGAAVLYVNGAAAVSRTIGGDFSNWNPSFDLVVGNEADDATASTSWQGEYRMVAVHCQALSAAQVASNYAAGAGAYATDYDPQGHGTHVAGIIGGNGSKSGGAYTGVAPGAAIIDVRVLARDGRGVVSDVIAGLDWVLANRWTRNIKVVNLSLGKAVEQSAALDPLVLAAEAVWDAGIVVVASAGNHGADGSFHITSPGNAAKVITVGSITDQGTGTNFTDDYVSTYSSRGPTAYDHFLKPDLLAPGNRVVAPISPRANLKSILPARIVSCGTECTGQYFELSGTSMSAAVVSGAVALMLTKEGLSNATVKARLMRSARKMNGDPTAVGAGVLDVTAALGATGWTGAAPSPVMHRLFPRTTVMVEDTRSTWGYEWSASSIWKAGSSWSNNFTESAGYLWSDAYLWSDGYLWSDAYLWSDSYLWSDGYLWSDAYLWSDSTNVRDLSANAFDIGD